MNFRKLVCLLLALAMTVSVFSTTALALEETLEQEMITAEEIAEEPAEETEEGTIEETVEEPAEETVEEPAEEIVEAVAVTSAEAMQEAASLAEETPELELNGGSLTKDALSGLIGEGYKYYGYARKGSTGNPTNVTGSARLSSGEYTAYATNGESGRIIKTPVWTDESTVQVDFDVHTYYVYDFTVEGEGTVTLNGTPIVDGPQNLWDDEEYVVAAQPAPGSILVSAGSLNLGEAFKPNSAKSPKITFISEYATVKVTVEGREGMSGSSVVTGDLISGEGAEEYMVQSGKSFRLVPKAKSGYYAKVLVNGAEPAQTTYTVQTGEVYEVSVVFARVSVSGNESVSFSKSALELDYDQLTAKIVEIIDPKFDPEEIAAEYTIDVKYQSAAGVFGIGEQWKALNNTSTSGGQHLFGKNNPEKIRLTYTSADPDRYPELVVNSELYIGEPVVIECAPITITYGDDLMEALKTKGGLVVKNEAGEVLDFPVTATPAKPDASTRTIVLTTEMQGDYLAGRLEVGITVNKMKASIKVGNPVGENTYIFDGKEHRMPVTVTPDGVDYVAITVGVSGDAKGYLNIDLPKSVQNALRLQMPGLLFNDLTMSLLKASGMVEESVLNALFPKENGTYYLDVYGYLVNNIDPEKGISIKEYVTMIEDVNKILESDIIKGILEGMGGSDIIQIMDILSRIIDMTAGAIDVFDPSNYAAIVLNHGPVKIGGYSTLAVTTGANYTTALGVAAMAILPAKADLFWNNDPLSTLMIHPDGIMVGTDEEGKAIVVPLGEEWNEYLGVTCYEAEGRPLQVDVLYTGISNTGLAVPSKEAPVKPGLYRETAAIVGNAIGGLSRRFTIEKGAVDIIIEADKYEYPFDEERAQVTAAVVFKGDEETLIPGAAAALSYRDDATGVIYREVPTEIGTYTIIANYAGSDLYKSATVEAENKLVITKRDVTITVTAEKTELVYGEIADFKSDPEGLGYEIEGEAAGYPVELIRPYVVKTADYPHVGSYQVKCEYKRDPHYNITVEGVSEITVAPRPIAVKLDDKTKVYGEEVPDFTGAIQPAEGYDSAFVYGEDESTARMPEIAISCEAAKASNAGVLPITAVVNVHEDDDYVLAQVLEAELTITKRPVYVTLKEATKTYGEKDPTVTYSIAPKAEGSGFTMAQPSDALIEADFNTRMAVAILTGGAFKREAGENAGEYQVQPDEGAYGVAGADRFSNYDIQFENGKLTIVPRPIEVLWRNTIEVKGVSSVSAVSSDLAFKDKITVKIADCSGEAGRYRAAAVLTDENGEDVAENYIVYNGGTDYVIAEEDEDIVNMGDNVTLVFSRLTDVNVLPEGMTLNEVKSALLAEAKLSETAKNVDFLDVTQYTTNAKTGVTDVMNIPGTTFNLPAPEAVAGKVNAYSYIVYHMYSDSGKVEKAGDGLNVTVSSFSPFMIVYNAKPVADGDDEWIVCEACGNHFWEPYLDGWRCTKCGHLRGTTGEVHRTSPKTGVTSASLAATLMAVCGALTLGGAVIAKRKR